MKLPTVMWQHKHTMLKHSAIRVINVHVRLKAHSHRARLRRYRTHAKRPARSHQARLRPSMGVDALKIEPCSILSAFTSVDGRRRASTSVYVRQRRVDHPMASDVVARDMFMNIQFIKSWTKYWSKLLEKKETLYMTLRPLTIEIMAKKNATGGKLPKK